MNHNLTRNMLFAVLLAGMSVQAFAQDNRSHDNHDSNKQNVAIGHENAAEHKSIAALHDNRSTAQPQPKARINSHANPHATVKPHQSWKTGSVVPSTYRTASYRISQYQKYHLAKPARNQVWYKINGDYVLINVLNHHVIRIVQGK